MPLGGCRRALVVKLKHHGDVLLAAPVLAVLKAHASHVELDALVYEEIARRRASGERGEDVLSLLLETELSDRHVRDEVMTLEKVSRGTDFDDA